MEFHGRCCVDPRLVVAGLPRFLKITLRVDFTSTAPSPATMARTCGPAAGQLSRPTVSGFARGPIVHTLIRRPSRRPGWIPCELQMMRTAPAGWRLGRCWPPGLTLFHYKAFAGCPSLPALKEVDPAVPRPRAVWHPRHGHPARWSRRVLVLGDSRRIRPGHRAVRSIPTIYDQLILDYLPGSWSCPNLTSIAASVARRLRQASGGTVHGAPCRLPAVSATVGLGEPDDIVVGPGQARCPDCLDN